MRPEARGVIAVLLLSLAACDATPPESLVQASAEPDIAASFEGGEIRLDAVELEIATARTPSCVQAKSAPGTGSVEDWIPCYREVAQALAVEDIVLADVADLDQALNNLDDDFAERRDAILLDRYRRQIAEQMEISDTEIEQFFAEHKDDMGTPRQFTLSNIFRRHRDPANTDQTITFLTRLKSRIDAGETFGAIAREHSDSETRLLDGRVGHLSEDKLPERLRAVAAALKNGEVSEPLVVNGGAVLIMITNATPAIEPDLDHHHASINQRLVQQKIQTRINERIAARPESEYGMIYSGDELFEQLDVEDTQQLIFELGRKQLTVAEFRQLVGLTPSALAAELPVDRQTQVIELYQQLERNYRLLMILLQSEDVADLKLREQVEKPLRKERVIGLVDELLQETMNQSVDQNPQALERFYSDNAHHYQSPLKFKLQIWHLPFDKNPVAQLAAMDRMRIELEQGDYPLPSAAERLGGTIDDLGWREFTELADLPGKARSYLLQATPGGYSIPYQQDDSLHMIWVEAQGAPQQLDYQSVLERVREDYIERFERRLYQDAVKQRLSAAKFDFYAENVRDLLLPPGNIGDRTSVTDLP